MADVETPAPTPDKKPAPETPKPPEPDPGAETISLSSAALKARLERERDTERKRMLAELGVEKSEDAKQALSDWKAKRDADKSELQRVIEKSQAFEKDANRAVALEAIIKDRVKIELELLTESQRQAVERLGAGDPGKTLAAIDALKPTWPNREPEKTAGTDKPNDKTAPKVPPVTTATTKPAPGEAKTSETDITTTYEELKKTNPFQAATFLNENLSKFPVRP